LPYTFLVSLCGDGDDDEEEEEEEEDVNVCDDVVSDHPL